MTDLIDPPALSRREARRRDRRDAILSVAQASFLENGYAATTMSSIAATLGGSKGTLWSYFPSKEELFAAVLKRAVGDYHARLTQILDPRGALEQTLRCFGSDLLDKVTSPEAVALNRLVTGEAGRFPEMGTIFFDIAPRHTRELLAGFLMGAMTRGDLRRADAAAAARTLILLILSGCHQQMLFGQIAQPTQEQKDADLAFAMDCFLRIYAPEKMT